MNNVNMTNMGPMGGPVGGPPMMNNGATGVPQQGGAQRQLQAHQDNRLLLNTYIYEYFLRYGMFDCARAILNSNAQVKVQKDSPGGQRDENGNLLGNGLGDDHMDTDAKDEMDQKRPDDLPAPLVPTPLPDSCFLYEWFCLFWDMLNAQKGKGSSGQVNQYVQHTQQQASRNRQEQQQQMLRHIRPEINQQNFHMMRNMQNGGMNLNMAMKPGQNPLPRTAMANSQNNPQAMHMLQQKAGQMQRDPSDMDGNRARPASPGSTENAPSPSKRPRMEAGPFNNPTQGVMMPNGRPAGQGMPGQQVGNGPNASAQQLLISHGINPDTLNPDQLQAFTNQNPHVQAKTIATYAANLQQHHGNQMPTKAMPNAPGPQNQGSPMVPQGNDPTQMANFYNAQDMGPGGMRPGPNGAQAGGGSNHALQDYQMQLMLLEQQNKKRLMMARQEQDLTGAVPRTDAGPGGPGGPGGPNVQGFQGTSPQGARGGASPNPVDQMKRGNPQLNNAASMGSPAPDGAHSHNSPNPINFIGSGQMDPMNAPHFFKGLNGIEANLAAAAAAGMNGNMRPPNSHPGQPFNGQMNPQMMRQQQQAGQGGAPMNWQAGMAGQQLPPQGAQPQVQGAPQQRSMPPPSAPAVGNAGNSRNATSSPQTSTAAPPTPQQANKAAPKKKDTKSAKSKAASQKKANANINASATPAAEPAPEPEAPTPATPITPVAPPAFNPKGQNAAPAPMVPNGQAVPPPPPPAPVAAQPIPDQSFSMDPGAALDFSDMSFATNPLNTSDVLNDFDFDSFLHDGTGEDGTGFDFTTGTYMENDGIGAD